MNRRQEIENIIIGTLLESTEEENYYIYCRSYIFPDAFQDENNRRIYKLIMDMNSKGKAATDPQSIFLEYGEKVLDLVPVMADRLVDDSFIHRKCWYNECQYIGSQVTGLKPKFTDVKFTDYVETFVKIVYDEERRIKTAV